MASISHQASRSTRYAVHLRRELRPKPRVRTPRSALDDRCGSRLNRGWVANHVSPTTPVQPRPSGVLGSSRRRRAQRSGEGRTHRRRPTFQTYDSTTHDSRRQRRFPPTACVCLNGLQVSRWPCDLPVGTAVTNAAGSCGSPSGLDFAGTGTAGSALVVRSRRRRNGCSTQGPAAPRWRYL